MKELNKPKYKKGDLVELTKDVSWVFSSREIVGEDEHGWPTFAKGRRTTFQKKGDCGKIIDSLVVPMGRGLVYYRIEGFRNFGPYDPLTGYYEDDLKLIL